MKPPRDLIVSEDSDTVVDGDVWEESYVGRVSKWGEMREELLKTLAVQEGNRAG